VSSGVVLVSLPLGFFVDEGFAVLGGIIGIYFVGPMLAALGLVVVAERHPPPALARVAVALGLTLWCLWAIYWGLLLGPYGWPATVVSIAVVGFASVRIWRASTSGDGAGGAAGGRYGATGGG
jgi:hypothetical protein